MFAFPLILAGGLGVVLLLVIGVEFVAHVSHSYEEQDKNTCYLIIGIRSQPCTSVLSYQEKDATGEIPRKLLKAGDRGDGRIEYHPARTLPWLGINSRKAYTGEYRVE